jgi:polyisoprenoid-binding protein YceI
MKLSGTSSLHSWVMNARTFTGQAEFDFKQEDKILVALKSLTFSLEVLKLKSDKRKLDKNAYKALKTEQHKNIIYKLISATVMPESKNKYHIKTLGNLSIAGITNEVTMDVYCLVNKDESITCTGSDELKMTDYEVQPPSFMMGAMKTGDAINLDFTLVYKK